MKRVFRKWLPFLLCVLVFTCLVKPVASASEEGPFRFALSKTDENGLATFTMYIPDGHLLYRSQTSFAAEGASVDPIWPPTQNKQDPVEGKTEEIYDAGTHTVLLRQHANVGVDIATITFSYQGCSSRTCFLPATNTYVSVIPTAVENKQTKRPASGVNQHKKSSGIASETSSPAGRDKAVVAFPAVASAAMAGQFQTPAGSTDFARILSENGSFWTLFIAFLGGLLVSFTPCVYPMIPITLSIIGGRDENTSIGRGFVLSLIYVAGLSLTYALFGVLVASFGAHLRGVLQGPGFQLLMAVIFGFLALSMFDVILLQVPEFLRRRLNFVRGAGFGGVFVLGMISGLMASPCVAAPLGGILAFIAATGSLAMGFFMLLSFAWGMGLLLIIVGIFSGSLNALPRAGEWMNRIKEFYGFLLAGGALYFARPVIGAPWGDLGIALLLASFSAFLGLFASTPSERATLGERVMRCWGVMALAIACAFCISATAHWGWLTLPETVREASAAVSERSFSRVSSEKPAWSESFAEVTAKVSRNHRPVLVDFRADWCDICRDMEERVFTAPDIEGMLRKLSLLKVDCTRNEGEAADLMKRFGIVGLPTLLVLNPDGSERSELRITGGVDRAGLARLLRHVLASQTSSVYSR
ncbi:MAG: protein-disulfide reductase DsbD [Candidatus Riflebacteria bacterium]|nr:protein-disulfide reductase DsbD [Candidatus Riflebacteria bacterium]